MSDRQAILSIGYQKYVGDVEVIMKIADLLESLDKVTFVWKENDSSYWLIDNNESIDLEFVKHRVLTKSESELEEKLVEQSSEAA
jgi:hypothetical protein